MTSSHIHMPINTAEEMLETRRGQHKLKVMFGFTSIKDLRLELIKMQRKGLTVIPSASCDNRKPTGECAGHSEHRHVPNQKGVCLTCGESA